MRVTLAPRRAWDHGHSVREHFIRGHLTFLSYRNELMCRSFHANNVSDEYCSDRSAH